MVWGEATRGRAFGLFGRGYGYKAAARALGAPPSTVAKWLRTYRAAAKGGAPVGGPGTRYGWETKVAAARAVVEGGASKGEAMGRLGVGSYTSLERWCRAYRGGGAEALRPAPAGRPRAEAPGGRGRELEREVRRLGAEVAYLKKSIALRAGKASRAGRRP